MNKLGYIPLFTRLKSYRREELSGDLIAGLIVAIMLIPQAMAYAMLAGLPPQVGLYASILPLFLYGLFGTSNSLAVGPVAMVSLLVISGVGEIAEPGSERFIALCVTLAFLAGIIQIGMAIFRLGFLVNFISHPVLVGFTSAAAIVIGFSQVKHLLGTSVERGEYPWQMIFNTLGTLGSSNWVTLVIGSLSCVFLFGYSKWSAAFFRKMGGSRFLAESASKLGPLIAVLVTSLIVFSFQLQSSLGVAIVGEIPIGLPPLTRPEFTPSTLGRLLPLALVITMVGYLESISVAKALAARRREKVVPNRELFALGMADIGASLTGGYPVTGGFSRSMVNFAAGARTPLASLITATLVAVAVASLTPLFYYIPQAVLASIIVVAVIGLIDVRTPQRLWRVCKPDAAALGITFVAVLGLGIETGVLIGVGATFLMQQWRASRPHIAEVGRLANSQHFRNVDRHPVATVDGLLALRVDESLTFSNAPFVEDYLQQAIAERPDVDRILLIASGINDIDSTGIDVLKQIRRELLSADIGFYLAEVKGPVMDRLRESSIEEHFLQNNVFLSTHEAVDYLDSEKAYRRKPDQAPQPLRQQGEQVPQVPQSSQGQT